MEILKKDAEEIVSEIHKLVGLKMNIVGKDAIIIANSDPIRVGNYHEATDIIIKEKLDELVVLTDTQYKGTHSGTNLPIVIDREIVGVVGVSGPYKIAVSYGKIIKKMTEIMLQTREEEAIYMRQMQARERFLASWICSSETVINDAFITSGNVFGIDISLPKRIITISLVGINEHLIEEQMSKIKLKLDSYDYVFFRSNLIICVLADREESMLKALIEQIYSIISDTDKNIYIGVDAGTKSFNKIHQQYVESKSALNVAVRLRNAHIVCYNDLNLELVLEEIPIESKLKYIRRLFVNYTPQEIARDLKTITILYEENGSIKRAANRLIIHPNTLQYQLKRIEEKTGYDPRKLNNASVFDMAALFQQELNDIIFGFDEWRYINE